MDWIYIIFTSCICFVTVLKTLEKDSDSPIFVFLTIVIFLVGMGMFPQLFSDF